MLPKLPLLELLGKNDLLSSDSRQWIGLCQLWCGKPNTSKNSSCLELAKLCLYVILLPWKLCYRRIMRKKGAADEKFYGSPGDCISLASNMLTDLVHPLLSFALLMFCLPILLLVSLGYRLCSNAITSTVLKKYSDAILVQHQDALCLHKSQTNVALLNCLLLLRGKADLAKLRKLIQERLVETRGSNGHLLLPKLTRYCKSIAGCSIWVKDEAYDIRDHVFKWTSQSPRTREELETLLGYLSSQALPRSKAPWQAVLIPSSSMLERQCFVLIRIHHSIADSATFTDVILKRLADVKPQHSQMPSSGVRQKYIQALKMLSTGPSLLLQKLSLPVEDHCLYGQRLSGDKLTSWSEQLDLALIKKMANMANSSTNAVLISCLTVAFRDYFRHHSHKVPDDMVACVSVPSGTSSSSFISEDRHSETVILSLPLKLADPMRQLEVIKFKLETTMASVEPTLNTLINSQFKGNMPLFVTSLLNRTIADKCTLVLSEVSCPESKVFIGGNAVEDIIVWSGLQANVGIGASIVSYNGQVKVTIMVDRAIMTDPSLLLSYFEAQLDQLAKMLHVL